MSPHNMVNFGPLTAEIDPVVWGTPANFNWFRVFQRYCTALQYWASAKPNFAALNRGRHLYSAGRPSRWILANISSCHYSPVCASCVQCFDTVGWVAGRASSL